MIRAALAAFLLATAIAHAQTVHTPKPGSAERQAICDAARVFVLSKYATAALPQSIVFKIDHLSVAEDYANLEAIPLFKDGSYVSANYLPDIGYNFCLQKVGGSWQVLVDLSRSDVPDANEIAVIRRNLSAFPRALFSPDWQKLLGD